jgi:heme-degrading monooxygenase HmoA
MDLQEVGYLILWEYEVRPGLEAQFEAIYESSGTWARLFSSSSMYYGTYLHPDANHPRRYSTLDLWASASAFEEFQKQHSAEYAALDRECEKLTLSEKQIGRFERST